MCLLYTVARHLSWLDRYEFVLICLEQLLQMGVTFSAEPDFDVGRTARQGLKTFFCRVKPLCAVPCTILVLPSIGRCPEVAQNVYISVFSQGGRIDSPQHTFPQLGVAKVIRFPLQKRRHLSCLSSELKLLSAAAQSAADRSF